MKISLPALEVFEIQPNNFCADEEVAHRSLCCVVFNILNSPHTKQPIEEL